MSRSRMEIRRSRRLVAALGVALVCGPAPASSAGPRSSPEDRQRFVSITRNLEQAPLNPGLKPDLQWALEWLIAAPDITVTICRTSLPGVVESKYPYAGEIVVQDMLSMGAFAIEHPEAANDQAAKQLAGEEGALNAYRSILRDKPDAKFPALDDLLQTQARGGLPEFARKAAISCAAKK